MHYQHEGRSCPSCNGTITAIKNPILTALQKGWHYQLERALDTRPPKVARAMQKHISTTILSLEKQFQQVLSTSIKVKVMWEEFIHTNEFLNWLDEGQYLAVMANASYPV